MVFSPFDGPLIAKFSDRKIWENNEAPDQTAILSASFGCITLLVKPHGLKFRIATAIFSCIQMFCPFVVNDFEGKFNKFLFHKLKFSDFNIYPIQYDIFQFDNAH